MAAESVRGKISPMPTPNTPLHGQERPEPRGSGVEEAGDAHDGKPRGQHLAKAEARARQAPLRRAIIVLGKRYITERYPSCDTENPATSRAQLGTKPSTVPQQTRRNSVPSSVPTSARGR